MTLQKVTTYFYYLLLAGVVFMLMAPWYWLGDIVVSFVPQFTIVSIVCLALLLWQRWYARAIILGVLTLYLAWPLLSLYYSESVSQRLHAETPVRREIAIMQVNVNKRNDHYQQLLDIIARAKPQIIVFNEFTDGWQEAMSAGLKNTYPFQVSYPSNDHRGMAVLSQLPIDGHDKIEYATISAPVLRLYFDQPEFTLYAVHPMSPISVEDAKDRNAVLTGLGRDVAATYGSIVVAGDFNITIHSVWLQNFLLTTRLHNSRQGYGWTPTWMRGTVLAAAIDHIFHSRKISTRKFEVLPDFGSDHRPIMATLVFE